MQTLSKATLAQEKQALEETTRLYRAVNSLYEFIRQGWHVVEPGVPFVPGRHIEAICLHLEAVTRGEIRNLIINMPPRHAKSLIVSVFWPCWVWIRYPEKRWLYSSYSLSLSVRDSRKCRMLIESPWYRNRFGSQVQLSSDQNAKMKFENTRLGHRMATSVNGSNTGEGGDFIVADDPHNVKEAESELVREEAIRWWDESMATRGNNPNTVCRVVVMQRVHNDDLSGHLLRKGGYIHLNLPAEFEPETRCTTPIWTDWREEEGDLLWPEQFNRVALADLKKELHSDFAVAGQLQQRPAPREGGLVKRDWFRYYDTFDAKDAEVIVQAWDTAHKTGTRNDFSVCQTVAKMPKGIYVLNVLRRKMPFPELKREAIEQHRTYRPAAVLVEDKSSGQSLIQELQEDTDLPILPIKVDADKEARFIAVTPYIQSGRLFLPSEAPWLAEYIREHCEFPAGHDDQVDTTSILLRYLLRFGQKNGGVYY